MPKRARLPLEKLQLARLSRIRAALRGLAVVSAATLVGVQAPGQDPQAPEALGGNVRIEGEYLVLSVNEQEGMDLQQFIKLAQEVTKKTFTYSAGDVLNAPDAKITFLGTKRIRLDNFFAFFQTMLYIKGFATKIHGDEDTEIIEIIFRQGPKRVELSSGARYVTPDEIPSYGNQTGVQILTSVPLSNINATAAQNQLRPFFLAGGGGGGAGGVIQFGVAGQALLMQGFGPQVYAAFQLLKLVDVPPDVPAQEVRVVRLEHAAADELEPILREILEDRNRRQQQATGVSGAELQGTNVGELKIVPHMTLNAILFSGTREQIIEGQELIAQLDVPLEATDGDTHVVRLKNVLAQDLYDTLSRFIGEDTSAEQQAQAGQTSGATRRPRKTVVVPHSESNSLLVSGTATKFNQLQRVIDDLDRRQPQVLIECAVIELTTSDSTRLAVELGLADLGGADPKTRPFGFTSFGLTDFDDSDGDGIPDTRFVDIANPIQGVTGGIFDSESFGIPVVVNALAADTSANILSLPSVVVNNNENALISSQEERPTQTVSQGTATTQSGAGTPENAGITLNISPSISSNNYLRLNIDLTVSRFTTAFDPGAVTAGVKAERQVQTQVTMPSGHTMVLGGVIEDRQSDTSSGIPLLKDIPLLGFLFQSWSTSTDKTNLYFFLTPHILDEEDFSDLAEQSFRKKLEAAEYIGHRRIQLIDRKWREGRPETLEDPGATIEDIDARGGFDIPVYLRPERTSGQPSAPAQPEGTATIDLGSQRNPPK